MGLGNPGSEYKATRHNVGFRVVQRLAERLGVRTWRSKYSGKLAEAASVDAVLLLPQTYMNDSGESVAACARFFKILVEDMLVVCDDINLPFGKLRFRARGSDGGHNGLKSIILTLNSDDFPRLRVGIGRSGEDAADHVLGTFTKDEEATLPGLIDRAVSGVEVFLESGTQAAIAAVNKFGGVAEAAAETREHATDG